jgi:solute:Na+ symporter, SSS family
MVSHSELLPFITVADWITFFLVLGLTLAAVIYGQSLKVKLSKKDQSGPLELLLMGRRLTMPLFIATLVATWYGGIFGVTALTFEKGIYNFLTQGIFWYLSYLIFALFLVKRIRLYNSMSIAGIAGSVLGRKAEKITAALNFLNLLPLAYTISLGLFLQALFGGSLTLNTLIGVSVVTLWSLWGGFRAVVFSDLIQFFFMIFGVLLVVIFSWIEYGNPIDLMQRLPPGHLDFSGGESLLAILVWGFIALSTLVDPNFYQRCLAARSEEVARKGIYVSIIIWIFFDLCTTLGALYARALLPTANPQSAYLLFSLQVIPDGFKGLFLAGILATILSSLDSYLFNAATCLSYDFLSNKEKFRQRHHHLALIAVAFLSVGIGSFFDGNIIEVWKTLGSFSAACLLFPLLLAQFRPGSIPEHSFCWAVIMGCLGIISWRVLGHFLKLPEIDEFYIGLCLTTAPLIPYLYLKK